MVVVVAYKGERKRAREERRTVRRRRNVYIKTRALQRIEQTASDPARRSAALVIHVRSIGSTQCSLDRDSYIFSLSHWPALTQSPPLKFTLLSGLLDQTFDEFSTWKSQSI